MNEILLKRLLLFDPNLKIDLINILTKYTKYKNLKKGDFFIKANTKNTKIGVLISGVLLATYIAKNGNEMVARIYSLDNDNILISSHESFFFNSDSTENIKAVSDVQLLYIEKEDLNSLKEKYHEVEKLIDIIAQYSYVSLTQRVRDLQSLPSKDRVLKYYKNYKSLFNKINKKDMASYLSVNRNDFTKFINKI